MSEYGLDLSNHNGSLDFNAIKNAKKKELEQLKSKLVLAEDAHPRQPRCINFGEELQMDACIHLWFGKEKNGTITVPLFSYSTYEENKNSHPKTEETESA